RASHLALSFRAGDDHFRNDRQRIHRSYRRSLHPGARCARAYPVPCHLHRARERTVHALSAGAESRGPYMNVNRYRNRRIRGAVFMGLSVAATLFGLSWLAIILGTLLYEGFTGLNLAVFTESTPPPGSTGGLLNAIVGSVMMSAFAVAVGTPLGILAGTYL